MKPLARHIKILQTRLRFAKIALYAFANDTKATASVEFALILPVLIASYFGTVEISRAYIAKNKVEAITETVADLVSQGKTITTTQLNDIFTISSKALLAAEEANINIVVTSVRTEPDTNGNPETTVRWSESKTGNSTYAEGATYDDLPAGIAKNYESIIITELYYGHTALFEVFIKGTKQFDRRFITKPRYSSDIPCTDC